MMLSTLLQKNEEAKSTRFEAEQNENFSLTKSRTLVVSFMLRN